MTADTRTCRVAVSIVCLLLVASGVARAQTLDTSFNPGVNGTVWTVAVQADGKILVGGAFTTLGGGGTGTTTRNRIGRLNADGSLDTSFNPGANCDVEALVVQADGKILVGGCFTTLGGGGTGTTTRNRIGRLNADGSLDTSFNPGASSDVGALVVQADGKIVVGGWFTTLGGGGTGTSARNRIGRLNADGSLDTTFNPGANDAIYTLGIQADGKILAGGAFTTLGGGGTGTATRNYLGRLNADGSLDTNFNPGADGTVWALPTQADGKIVVGGEFTMLGGGGTGTTTRNHIGRLNSDGSLDTSFDPGASDAVEALKVQADAKILVGGAFLWLGGGTGTTLDMRIGRINPDGSVDTTFIPGADAEVLTFAVQTDGKVVVGGNFTMLGGGFNGTTTRNGVGRLTPAPGVSAQPANQTATVGATVSFSAEATGSPVPTVQWQVSTNQGVTWTNISGATSTPYTFTVALGDSGNQYRAVFTNSAGSAASDAAGLIVYATEVAPIDTRFNPGANAGVSALALQADGKVLVGGSFTTLGGGGNGTTTRNHLGRLNADGSLDASFNPGTNGAVDAIVVQADGKIVVGGEFTTLGGGGTGTTARNHIGRLNADGSLDTTFNPGADFTVFALALQADGKILAGGDFGMLGGGGTGTVTRNYLGRLNVDGSLDATFNPGADSNVYAITVQADGRILVGGDFSALGGGTGTTPRNYLGRLDDDGSVDTSFDPGADGDVYVFALQADGKILVGGSFGMLGGGGAGATSRECIGRLNADGSVDTSFDPGADGGVYAIALQADGKILAGGDFTTLGGGGAGTTMRNYIGRLNADGSLDNTFNPGADDDVNALVVQSDGQVVVGGFFTMLGGGGTGMTSRTFIGRLAPVSSPAITIQPASQTVPAGAAALFAAAASGLPAPTVQWQVSTTNGGTWTDVSGATSATYTFTAALADSTKQFRAVFTNSAASATTNAATLTVNAKTLVPLDASFNPGANGDVYALAIQADGKILVGGHFTTFGGGGTGTTIRKYLARLNADGSLDASFNPGADDDVKVLALQADGKILVGGNFTMLGGGTGTTTRYYIGRLNADGSLDMSFNPGASGTVDAIAVQPDGKIVVGGIFTTLGGGDIGSTARNCLGRLNADGSVDTSFNPGAGGVTFPMVNALALQADGKIVVGGDFKTLGGGTGTTPRNYVGRINADGSLDTSFNPGADSEVNALALQADGKILIGGSFSTLGGGGTGTTARNDIGRLNADGSLDTSFNPGASGSVYAIAVQSDGKILLGGLFTTLGGGGFGSTARNYLGRLNADGSVDASFDPGANLYVWTLAVQADGQVLVGGFFTALGGGGTGTTTRYYFGRLNGTATSAPAVTTQPSNVAVTAGATAFFSAAASGTPTPTVQWQISTNKGSTWSDLAGATGTACSYATAASDNGTRFRAVFTNSAGTATTAPVTLTVYGAESAAPAALRFGATKAGAAGALTAATAAQTVTVSFAGAGSGWTASADTSWVQITGGAGTGAGAFTVAIANPGNVIGGSTSLAATITVTAPSTPNTAVTVPVTLTVDQTGVSTVPAFGQVDTPAQGAPGVVGAIGVTGWVVDDVGISSVKVYRNCLSFENQASCQTISGNNVVFIGDAAFVAGARPDVEAAFPTYPAANVSGWGYLLLTNMLPHVTNRLGYGGQGSLNLYVFATDLDGHVTLLGRNQNDHTPTAITMANDSITKPFGAIDTPSQGGTVSGTFANFGWVLTPDLDTVANSSDILMPTDGSTMHVFVDGASVGTVAYNQCRGNVGNPVPAGLFCNDDVASIFGNATPQATFTPRIANTTVYRNLDAARSAIGAFTIDTTLLTNGMHSIAWGVTDTAGRSEGIGSRNFFVLNSSGDAALAAGSGARDLTAVSASAEAAAWRLAPVQRRGDVTSLPAGLARGAVVTGRIGFSLATPLADVAPEADGVRRVQIPDLGRIELNLGGPVDAGYLIVGDLLRDLPIGSHLDGATGVFTWAPVPGFLGTYRLVFVQAGEQLPIDVTIRPMAPAAAGESEIRMNVDLPIAGGTVSGSVMIAGWALDPQAWTGSGIDAIHVWAYRRDAPSTGPQFLGAADLHALRPDVAQAFGAAFDRAGFGLVTTALAPGEYDLVVYAWCERTGRWDDARTVRVTVR